MAVEVRISRGTIARSFALAMAAFLLVGQGEQIVAAPVTVPLLVWGIRSSRSISYRVAAVVVCVATLLVVGWFIAYSVWGVSKG